MIIVTGGAGFIGSNLVYELNQRGESQILIVDNLTNAAKFKNLVGLKAVDYMDKQDFLEKVQAGKFNSANVRAIFHQGACSDTMEYNGKYMLQNNFEYSKQLLHFALNKKIQFIYASSASTYGNGLKGFKETPECEHALNVYAFSKLFFDRYVQQLQGVSNRQIVGLKYFNVYGPQENHKGRMASVAYQFYNQLQESDTLKLFEGVDGYANGEQRRDFIYVKDVAKVNLFFLDNPQVSGIFNCGTGKAQSFNDVAKAVIKHLGRGKIEYIPFPEVLKGKYQSFTQADASKLLAAGYTGGFSDVATGVAEYCQILDQTEGYYA